MMLEHASYNIQKTQLLYSYVLFPSRTQKHKNTTHHRSVPSICRFFSLSQQKIIPIPVASSNRKLNHETGCKIPNFNRHKIQNGQKNLEKEPIEKQKTVPRREQVCQHHYRSVVNLQSFGFLQNQLSTMMTISLDCQKQKQKQQQNQINISHKFLKI